MGPPSVVTPPERTQLGQIELSEAVHRGELEIRKVLFAARAKEVNLLEEERTK
jgi:hypothetical protein